MTLSRRSLSRSRQVCEQVWKLSVLLAGFAATAAAQAPAPRKSGVFVSAGPAILATRDDATSPLAFSGLGGGVEVGFASVGAKRFEVALGLGATRLASAASRNGLPSETAYRAELRVAQLYPLGPSLRLGPALAASVTPRVHRYADPNGQDDVYVFSAATLGPMIEWRSPLGVRGARASLALPVLAALLRPWSDARLVAKGATEVTWAIPTSFLAADGRVEWTGRAFRSVRLGYHVEVERYSGALRYRSVRQGVYASLAFPREILR